jgi:hypothetical protein
MTGPDPSRQADISSTQGWRRGAWSIAAGASSATASDAEPCPRSPFDMPVARWMRLPHGRTPTPAVREPSPWMPLPTWGRSLFGLLREAFTRLPSSLVTQQELCRLVRLGHLPHLGWPRQGRRTAWRYACTCSPRRRASIPELRGQVPFSATDATPTRTRNRRNATRRRGAPCRHRPVRHSHQPRYARYSQRHPAHDPLDTAHSTANNCYENGQVPNSTPTRFAEPVRALRARNSNLQAREGTLRASNLNEPLLNLGLPECSVCVLTWA